MLNILLNGGILMSIQGMREFVKTHRVLIGVLLGLIVVSLLVTFAIGGLSSVRNVGGQQAQTDYSGFEESIATQKAELEANPTDYAANYNLANTYYEYAVQLAQSTEQADQDKSFEMLAEAGPLYITALENAPDDLNDLARAQMYTKAAKCFASTDQEDVAEGYYQEAVKLAPTDLDTCVAYAQYLAYTGDYEGSIQVMNDLIAGTDDETVISSANSFIEQIKALQSSAESTDTTEDTEDNATEDVQ